MDGVVSEWVASAAHAFGMSHDHLMAQWPAGVADIESALRVTKEKMWRVVDSLGGKFWAELPETPWARQIYDGACKMGPVVFLTSPSHHPSSLAGKLTWMKKFTGNPRFRDYIITARKELCAGPMSILVDDHDGNLHKFIAAGGHGVCLPRRWNSMHAYEGDPCDYALRELGMAIDRARRIREMENIKF